MNTGKSITNVSNKFIYQFTDNLNLKNHNKNMVLAKVSVYYTWKNNMNMNAAITNLRSLLQLGMMNSIYLTDLILFLIFKIILNISLKNMRL